jgi:16S rRNA (adenine(1408)-N(1))-methyltransferase
MEIIRGKDTSFIDRLAYGAYQHIHIDIGTGDGRFVRQLAQTCPQTLVIGVDANRENLCGVSRRAPSNTLFVIANALSLPAELSGTATSITINFPWGSLMQGLADGHAGLMEGLTRIARNNAPLDVRLNAGALAEAGWTLEAGVHRVREVLNANGFKMRSPVMMTAKELKLYPTTWAKRLAFGRDPRAMGLSGVKHS